MVLGRLLLNGDIMISSTKKFQLVKLCYIPFILKIDAVYHGSQRINFFWLS